MAMMNENQTGIENSVSLYRYDQLNRLKKAEVILSPAGLSYNASNLVGNPYRTTYNYDPNGNILSLTRNGDATNLNMDDFTYNYQNNRNRLTHVEDVYGNVTGNDLPNQSAGNYSYDAMGNLIADASEEIASIEWDVRGKVRKVTRTATSTKSDLEFFYDALGQRVMKVERKKNVTVGGQIDVTTIYVRDATGNVMAVYTGERVLEQGNLNSPVNRIRQKVTLDEHHLYGASRLGMETYDDMLLSDVRYYNNPILSFILVLPNKTNEEFAEVREVKMKRYELSSHLGTVHVVLSDRKLSVEGGPGETGHYLPDVVSWSDGYAFGMLKPGRSGGEVSYRYGNFGHEKEVEISGSNSHFSAEYWMVDVRIGKRWDIDPIIKPWQSPYSILANNPIWFTDPIGLDTFNVVSSSYNAQGTERKKGQPGLVLFTVYTNDFQTEDLNYNIFEKRYQTMSESISYSHEGTVIVLDYAKVLNINSDNPFFSKAVKSVSPQNFYDFWHKTYSFMYGIPEPNNFTKLAYFGHGDRFDIKTKLFEGYHLVYLEGVGIFRGDVLGNIFYGSIWSFYQGLGSTLKDGDYLQYEWSGLARSFWNKGKTYNFTIPRGIDDPVDSYGLALGHFIGNKGFTKENIFGTISSFEKESRSTNYYLFRYSRSNYKVHLKNGESWKANTKVPQF